MEQIEVLLLAGSILSLLLCLNFRRELKEFDQQPLAMKNILLFIVINTMVLVIGFIIVIL